MSEKDYRTVTVDGEATRVRFTPKRTRVTLRHAGLMPTRVETPDTTYRRRPKHRHLNEEDET